MVALGLRRDVDPPQALLEEVHRTAGHVAWLAGIVAQLDPDALVRGVTRIVQPNGTRRVEAEAAVNTWVQLYQRERDLLRRVCATAIRAGAADWQVRVAAEQAQVMIGVVLDAFDEVGLPVELQWRLRKAIAANLRRHAAQVAE